MKVRFAVCVLGLIGVGSVTTADAEFFDQGFVQTPVVRTDYLNPNAGTAAAPLNTTTCHYNEQNGCDTLNTMWSQSNYWTMNWPNCTMGVNCPNFWILTMNNETSNDNVYNSGPPDASLPRSAPGAGIMGFDALHAGDNFPGDTFWRAHLVLNLNYRNPQIDAPPSLKLNATPFLGFGAFANRGNGQPIGYLNRSAGGAAYLNFDARLWASTLPQSAGGSQQGTIVSWVQVFANWGSHPKAIQLALYHSATGDYLTLPTMTSFSWDWRWTDSAYSPGAVMASSRAEDMINQCSFSMPSLVLNQDVHYSINLQALFQCFSNHNVFHDDSNVNDPLPLFRVQTNIPITIVNWANEGTGINGGIWTDVHNMSISYSP